MNKMHLEKEYNSGMKYFSTEEQHRITIHLCVSFYLCYSSYLQKTHENKYQCTAQCIVNNKVLYAWILLRVNLTISHKKKKIF